MKVAKVAVSLPSELIAEIDRERHATRETRSAYFRAVLERHVREASRSARTQAYVRGYRAHPESDAELAATEALAEEALRELDWE